MRFTKEQCKTLYDGTSLTLAKFMGQEPGPEWDIAPRAKAKQLNTMEAEIVDHLQSAVFLIHQYATTMGWW